MTTDNLALHRFAVFTACCTVFLIFVGGLVTSTESGLSVPDWPTTYGWNMFTFPVSKWVGGIFYEHGHRLTVRLPEDAARLIRYVELSPRGDVDGAVGSGFVAVCTVAVGGVGAVLYWPKAIDANSSDAPAVISHLRMAARPPGSCLDSRNYRYRLACSRGGKRL